MFDPTHSSACCGAAHFSRRTLLQAGLGGIAWLTPLSRVLARAAEAAPKGAPARSVIVLWLAGGPSQLETFDPHPGKKIAGGTKAIKTKAPGILLGAGFEQTAEQMDVVSIVRSVVSKEGDHERATYNVKTGFRPDPTLVHPSIGAVVCREFDKADEKFEIPRHVSIIPNMWPGRGGYLGDHYDAFKVGDPSGPIPDVAPRVKGPRFQKRLDDLTGVVETEFARGRIPRLENGKSLSGLATEAARKMMSSEQLKAFNVNDEADSLRKEYGDSAFGRGCLAAVRLIEAGVRCVEVTLDGFDSHAANHDIHAGLIKTLDPAYAALLRDLRRRKLLDSTIVICGGEFGRTPTINPAGGRDHWPHGFSVALAGGGLAGGMKVGETAAEPKLDEKDPLQDVKRPVQVEDIHATVLHALGIDFSREIHTPIERPMAISQGKVISELIAS